MRPQILILDDFFGRDMVDGRNVDRENLCSLFKIQDASDDVSSSRSRLRLPNVVAEGVFHRCQKPLAAEEGDMVENDLDSALAAVRSGWPGDRQGSRWAMVLVDLCFYTGRVTEESDRRNPGMPEGGPEDDLPGRYFGLTLLEAIHREYPELPLFVLSSKSREEVSLEFSRRGALGFIDRTSRDAPEQLQRALWTHGLMQDESGTISGSSLPMLLAMRDARRCSQQGGNILIRGKRGSGKELMARYIRRMASEGGKNLEHTAERRPFVEVNSAVFTPNLFSSELFGIEARTATGVDRKSGLIEMADGGDLFLDEIADMPAEVQAAMLRVLQDGMVQRVGGRSSRKVDVRFISATNRDLEDEKQGFRADLLDRLRSGGSISLPPLRDRKEDLPQLCDRFLREAESQRKEGHRHDIHPDAMEILSAYGWPGNVRELRSVIFSLVSRYPDVEHIVPEHIQLVLPDAAQNAHPIIQSSEAAPPLPDSAMAGSLAQLKAISFRPEQLSELVGKYGELSRELRHVEARYLRLMVESTKRRTAENPDGTVLIHPAAKLATGNSNLTASNAADFFKRTLGPLEHELTGDLAEALAIARRLRPKPSAKKPA